MAELAERDEITARVPLQSQTESISESGQADGLWIHRVTSPEKESGRNGVSAVCLTLAFLPVSSVRSIQQISKLRVCGGPDDSIPTRASNKISTNRWSECGVLPGLRAIRCGAMAALAKFKDGE
jgi:hypothetical protein